jgi:hypothetical protein
MEPTDVAPGTADGLDRSFFHFSLPVLEASFRRGAILGASKIGLVVAIERWGIGEYGSRGGMCCVWAGRAVNFSFALVRDE